MTSDVNVVEVDNEFGFTGAAGKANNSTIFTAKMFLMHIAVSEFSNLAMSHSGRFDGTSIKITPVRE